MYHEIEIVGYLGKDPEMRYTPSGDPVTNFSVATTRKWTGSDDKQKEETTWFRVTAWRRMAETCNQYLKKGSPVLVKGRLNSDENGGPRIWTDNNGNPRASHEVTATMVKFLPNKNGNNSQPAPQEDDEEIPFG
jgi:single-strand DNA-binding protein